MSGLSFAGIGTKLLGINWGKIGAGFVAVGKFLLKHWRETAMVLLLWLAWHHKGQIADLQAEAQGWDAAVTTLSATLEINKSAIAECHATNEQNTVEVTRLGVALDQAEARVTLLDERATDTIEGFTREANAIRGTDPTCRTLDDALPDTFVGSVRSPAGADHH